MADVEQKTRRRTVLARIVSLLLAAFAVVLYVSGVHERQSIEWPGGELLLAIAACFVLGFFGVTFSRKTVLAQMGLALLILDACVFAYVRWVYDPGYGDWAGFEVLFVVLVSFATILLGFALSFAGLILGNVWCGLAGIACSPLVFMLWVWGVQTNFGW
ncbi:MAG TPA: hypothetical protein VMZ31_19515 [Phycisphaerae bacterium]|nr:hypothetical protein [Phycisphaerae bacterium]